MLRAAAVLRPRALALALTVPLAVGATGVRRAAAHAPPEVLQVLSSEPAAVVFSTNRGFVFGSRGGDDWTLLCNEAFGVDVGTPYRAALVPGGRMLVAEQAGLRFSDDRGCTWQRHAELGTLATPALAQHPQARARLYLTVHGFDGTHAVRGVTGVRRSDDGGATFRTVYAAPEGEFLNSLQVSGGEPGHVYASATAYQPGGAAYLVLHSPDGGASWERHLVEADAQRETDVTLLAINPRDPQELLARASGTDPVRGERLLWSRDGGRTFQSAGRWAVLRSAAFSADGKVAFASYRDGLLRADDAARTFARAGVSTSITSVSVDADRLLAGGYYAGERERDGLATGSVDDPDAKLATLMTFAEVRAHARCPAPSTAEADCDALWRDWRTEQGLDAPGVVGRADGGAPSGDRGAGSDGGTSGSGTSDGAAGAKESGCTLIDPQRAGAAWWLALSLVAALARRRERASRC